MPIPDLELGLFTATNEDNAICSGAEMDLIKDYKECCHHLPSRISVFEFGVNDEVLHKPLNWDPANPRQGAQDASTTVKALEDFWSQAQEIPQPDLAGHLYIIEDPCHRIFQALQEKFQLHIGFQARHLFNSVVPKYEAEKDWEKRIPLRMISSTYTEDDRSGISLRYYDLFQVVTVDPEIKDTEVLLTGSNVKRRATRYSTSKGLWGSFQALSIMRNISLQVLPAKTDEPWKAILLVDKPVSQDWHLSPIGFGVCHKDIRNYRFATTQILPIFMSEKLGVHGFASADASVRSSDPEVADAEVLLAADPVTLMDTIVHFWTAHATRQQIRDINHRPLQLRVLMAKTASTMWTPLIWHIAELCSLLDYRGEEIEDNIRDLNRSSSSEALSHIREILAAANKCRRLIRWSMAHLRVNLALCRSSNGELDASGKQFVPILEQLQFEMGKVESLMPVVLGCSNLLEVHQNARENSFVARLTTIAVLFLPLSALASFFGMEPEFLPGGRMWMMVWATAVPVTVGLLLFMYWNEMRARVRIIMEGR